MTAPDALQRAAIAWRDLKHAEAEIARLNRYTNMGPWMKSDRAKQAQIAGEARKVLDETLKVEK